MNSLYLHFYRTVTSSVVLLGFLSSLVSPAYSQIRYNPQQNLGAPRTTIGGGTRGDCVEQDLDCLMVLMPIIDLKVNDLPLTISSHPTFFLSVPNVQGEVVFKLYEENQNSSLKRIYETSFSSKGKTGIMSYKLPKNSPALEVNKSYSFEFTLSTASRTYYCEGEIKRIALDSKVSSKLNQAQPLKKAAIYAEAGIWFEALQTLAEARYIQPNNSELQAGWTELLSSVKLDKTAKLPLIKNSY